MVEYLSHYSDMVDYRNYYSDMVEYSFYSSTCRSYHNYHNNKDDSRICCNSDTLVTVMIRMTTVVNVPRSKCILWVSIVVAIILNGVDTLVTVIYGYVL